MSKKIALFFILFFACFLAGYTQVYLPLTDNMIIPSNSDIKIAAMNYSLQDVAADVQENIRIIRE